MINSFGLIVIGFFALVFLLAKINYEAGKRRRPLVVPASIVISVLASIIFAKSAPQGMGPKDTVILFLFLVASHSLPYFMGEREAKKNELGH